MVDLDPPSPNGVDVLYSHEYVAEQMRERNLYGYIGNNPATDIDSREFNELIREFVDELTERQRPPPSIDSRGGSCIGGCHGRPAPYRHPHPGIPQTPDSICDNIKCANVKCTPKECRKLLKQIRDIAAQVPNPLTSDPCEKWAFAFEQMLTNKHLGQNPCVKAMGQTTFKWFTPWTGHAAYRFDLCDGNVWYVDNVGPTSIGGPDHIGTKYMIPFWMWGEKEPLWPFNPWGK